MTEPSKEPAVLRSPEAYALWLEDVPYVGQGAMPKFNQTALISQTSAVKILKSYFRRLQNHTTAACLLRRELIPDGSEAPWSIAAQKRVAGAEVRHQVTLSIEGTVEMMVTTHKTKVQDGLDEEPEQEPPVNVLVVHFRCGMKFVIYEGGSWMGRPTNSVTVSLADNTYTVDYCVYTAREKRAAQFVRGEGNYFGNKRAMKRIGLGRHTDAAAQDPSGGKTATDKSWYTTGVNYTENTYFGETMKDVYGDRNFVRHGINVLSDTLHSRTPVAALISDFNQTTDTAIEAAIKGLLGDCSLIIDAVAKQSIDELNAVAIHAAMCGLPQSSTQKTNYVRDCAV